MVVMFFDPKGINYETLTKKDCIEITGNPYIQSHAKLNFVNMVRNRRPDLLKKELPTNLFPDVSVKLHGLKG